MKRVLLSLGCLAGIFIFSMGIFCEEDLLEVGSESCDFDGKKLMLSGSVAIDHDLGHITAAEATLYVDREGKKSSIGLFELRKNVEIVSKEGSELLCGFAQLNNKTRHGYFSGSDPNDFVIFRENSENNEGLPFTVRSREMQAVFSKEGLQEKNHAILNEIIATKDVNVDYDNNFHISADRGVYQRHHHLDSDQEFLRVSGNVLLEMTGTGTLKTNEEVEIDCQVVQGKRTLRSIESHGETMLTHPELLSGYEHHLYCFGNVVVDNAKMTITFDSPSDLQGQVQPCKQVVFRDSLGEIHSNKLVIFYQNSNGKISPLRMLAVGQVYMLDRNGVPASDEAALLRYALADQAEYTFANKEALFTAKKTQRVLLLDKINNLQVSAPALRIIRDGPTHKETIQGIGDVRFSFRENEAEQFKDRFEALPHRY